MKIKKPCALLLFSGGLDSILAAKILQNAGCEVTALTFETPFFDAEKAREAAKNLGIEIIVKDISQIHFKLLRDPPHGFGKNMNPCVDCHGLMFRLATLLLTSSLPCLRFFATLAFAPSFCYPVLLFPPATSVRISLSPRLPTPSRPSNTSDLLPNISYVFLFASRFSFLNFSFF